VVANNTKLKDLWTQHCQLLILIQILAVKLNVYFIEHAGADKPLTHPKALNLPFRVTRAVVNEFKLTGFMNTQW
jgi:hypothetical protein